MTKQSLATLALKGDEKWLRKHGPNKTIEEIMVRYGATYNQVYVTMKRMGIRAKRNMNGSTPKVVKLEPGERKGYLTTNMVKEWFYC